MAGASSAKHVEKKNVIESEERRAGLKEERQLCRFAHDDVARARLEAGWTETPGNFHLPLQKK